MLSRTALSTARFFFLPRALVAVGMVVFWAAGASLSHAQPDTRGVKAIDSDESEAPSGRVALVFGNSAYTAISALENANNDAEDMAAALRRLDFDVIQKVDRPRDEMREAIRTFRTRADGAEVALLFYAGHGVEVDGESYLIPVDVGGFGEESFRIDQEAIPLGEVFSALQGAETQVVMLDACRNDPFPEDVISRSGASEGWAMFSHAGAGNGTLVAYGTGPGSVALDGYQDADGGQSRNGLFTGALLAEMREPGLEAGEIMRRVRGRVREVSDYVQNPWTLSSYVQPFYFITPDDQPDSLSVEPVMDVETWAGEGRAAYERKDYAAARDPLSRAAHAGHTDSQYLLGTMYFKGREVPESPEQAANWFKLAVRGGHVEAQYFLGGMYSSGIGVPRDDCRAADLYERAARQDPESEDDPRRNMLTMLARFRMGAVYEEGRCRPQDVDVALQWYRRSAREGYAGARDAIEKLAREGNVQAQSILSSL